MFGRKIQHLVIICIFIITGLLSAGSGPVFMPIPESVELTEEKLVLDENFTVGFDGIISERILFNGNRFIERLAGRTGLFFEQGLLNDRNNVQTPTLHIKVKREGELLPGVDESYKLSVTSGNVVLEAETDIGAIRGLETLLQLLDNDENSYFLTGSKIEDSPRFVWRGLLMDVCRHFMPVEVVKRNLRGLAAVKMNVLHLHLSEDQGFRVESKIYPLLTEKGSDGKYFTQEEIKDIVEYASLLGIRVVPEFDIPGHATSWLVGYPELGSKEMEYNIERKWGVFDASLNPTNEATYEFLDNLFGEMTELFPDPYFHIGGDENSGKHWEENESIQQFMKDNDIADNHALQAYFNNRVLKILTNHNKKLVGWDEIQHENMPSNIVIQSWRGKEGLEKAAKSGFQVILSNGYYIDLIHPAEQHYLNDPLPEENNLTQEEEKLVLGGEATMWAEFVSEETVDSRIWPRTAAIAERLWSQNLSNDIRDMYDRLDYTSFRLEESGLLHIKNQEMFLRRLTGNGDTKALKILVDVIEPLRNYQRGRYKNYTQQSPLTRVVDAAVPDAPDARKFEYLVEDYIAGSGSNEEILYMLNSWHNNHEELLKIIKQNPVLSEIETLSKDLSEISGEMILMLTGKKKKSDSGIEKMLEKAKEQRGQTVLMVIDPLKKLLNKIE